MQLTGKQVQQIQDALLDGYPSKDELRMLVRVKLDHNLDAIVGGDNLRVMTFNLVNWAERCDRVDDLIQGASDLNPDNKAIQQLAQEWRTGLASQAAVQLVAAAPPSPPVGRVSIDLFLCYSRKNLAVMRTVRDCLREAELSVWTDEGLEPGTPAWASAIEDAIGQAQALVVLLSPDAKASAWVGKEVTYAQVLGKRVFTALVAGDTPVEAVPVNLIDVQWVDARQDLRQVIAQELVPPLLRHIEQTRLRPTAQITELTQLLPPSSTPSLDIEWVSIPAGAFIMGTDNKKDSQAYPDEGPPHTVYLSQYQIAKYPITNGQYAVFVEATRYKPPRHWAQGAIPRGRSRYPVVFVSWDDANEFCRWASELTTRSIRLPSEAEWEKAARGTDGRIWPWGNQPPSEQRCSCDADLESTTPVDTHPAGASFYGVMDMAGNAWEWTTTIWGPRIREPYFKYPYAPQDGRERTDAPIPCLRVLRGGAYVKYAKLDFHARCTARGRYLQDRVYRNIGFRVLTR